MPPPTESFPIWSASSQLQLNLDHLHSAVHSFILDVSDPCWRDEFTGDKLQTIMSTGNPKLPPLERDVQNVFEHCLRHTLEVCDRTRLFDPRSQPDQDWIQRTLLDHLNLYLQGNLTEIISQGTEMDFVVRCWSNLDKCYDDLAVTGRDRTCMSTLVRINAKRAISGARPIEEQQRSVRPDMLVMKDGLDFAVTPPPKILKDMLNRALSKGKNAISLARALRVVALNHNSTLMQVLMLDCRGGYVCRLLNTDEYEIPRSPALIIAELFPIMKLKLKTKNRHQSEELDFENFWVFSICIPENPGVFARRQGAPTCSGDKKMSATAMN
ncbi:hypothetical protein VTP01DRAFT_10949 [Rhizomucor pusillus]|uniref:uncharacterized protein n=1 Tax=Rhizomucor pusillus TaxID=4840 RepID=UPI00374296C8